MESLTLTTGEVARALGYFHRDGQPNRTVVRALARDGRIPPPIDMELATVLWRWSRAEIEAYVAGQWKAVG